MSELLSIVFAAIFASALGLNYTAASNTKTGPNGEKPGPANARLDFKQAESTANSVYKTSIIDCKKKPSPEKKICLDEARAVNSKAIETAKHTAITTTASSAGQ